MPAPDPKPYYNEDRILAKMPPALKPLARKLDFTDLCLFYWVCGKLQRGLPLKKGAEKNEAQRIFGQADPKLMGPEAIAEAKQRATPNLAYFQMDAPKVFDTKDPLFSVLFGQQVDATKKVFATHWPKDHTAARSQERVKEGIIQYSDLMPYIQGRGYVGTRSFFFPQEVYDRIRGKKANIADERLFPNRERMDVNTAQKAFDSLIGEFKDAKQTEVRSPIKLLKANPFYIVFAGQNEWALSLLPLILLNLAGYTRFEIVMSQGGSFQVKDADTGEVLAYAMPVRLK
jgi:hypothetical protein